LSAPYNQLVRSLVIAFLSLTLSLSGHAADFADIDFSDDLDALSSGNGGNSESLDSELNRLDLGGDISIDIDGDIERWDQAVASEKSQQHQAKLDEVGKRCDRFWNQGTGCSLTARFGITLDSHGPSPHQLAYEYCEERYPDVIFDQQSRRYRRSRSYSPCRDNKEEEIIEERRQSARRAAREKRSREENYLRHCEAERSYCGSAKADFDAGLLPTAAEPNWKPVDEETFRGMLDEIDADYQAQQDDRATRHKSSTTKAANADAKQQAKTNARLLRKAAGARASGIRKENNERWCNTELAAGRDWCSCPTPPSVKRTSCAK
jgi:hypothetical protein